MILFSEHASDSQNFDQRRVSTFLYDRRQAHQSTQDDFKKEKQRLQSTGQGREKPLNCFQFKAVFNMQCIF